LDSADARDLIYSGKNTNPSCPRGFDALNTIDICGGVSKDGDGSTHGNNGSNPLNLDMTEHEFSKNGNPQVPVRRLA
jgi:hypothetical protein